MRSCKYRSILEYAHVWGEGTNLQLLGNGANNPIELLPVLEGDERGHLYPVSETQPRIEKRETYSRNANTFGNIFGSFNIDLVETDGWGLPGESFEDGADHSAWATPGCPEIEDDDLAAFGLIINRPKEWGLKVSLGTRGAVATRWTHELLELSKIFDWRDGFRGWFHDDSEGGWESM